MRDNHRVEQVRNSMIQKKLQGRIRASERDEEGLTGAAAHPNPHPALPRQT